MKDMFCFQCEQTAGSVGCMGKAGVCGKQASTANLQDDLTGAMIGLAQVAELSKPTDSTTKVMLEGLFTTITNVNFDDEVLQKRIADVHREKALLGAKVDFPEPGTPHITYNLLIIFPPILTFKRMISIPASTIFIIIAFFICTFY